MAGHGLNASQERDVIMREALVRRHASAVLAVCLAQTRNLHDAEDVMQEVFMKAFAKFDALRDKTGARAWLLQIARRTCVDYHRRRVPRGTIPDDVPERTSPDNADVERLRAAIARLPERYRESITLYYLDGRSCAGVAENLGISESAVRRRLSRARLMLNDLLTEDKQ